MQKILGYLCLFGFALQLPTAHADSCARQDLTARFFKAVSPHLEATQDQLGFIQDVFLPVLEQRAVHITKNDFKPCSVSDRCLQFHSQGSFPEIRVEWSKDVTAPAYSQRKELYTLTLPENWDFHRDVEGSQHLVTRFLRGHPLHPYSGSEIARASRLAVGMEELQLRKIQTGAIKSAIEASDRFDEKGLPEDQKELFVSPTGTGKTEVLLALLKHRLKKHPKKLHVVIADKNLLVDQLQKNVEKMRSKGVKDEPEFEIIRWGGADGDSKSIDALVERVKTSTKPIVLATTIQSLKAEVFEALPSGEQKVKRRITESDCAKLREVLGTIAFDETHHAGAEEAVQVLEKTINHEESSAFLIGTTPVPLSRTTDIIGELFDNKAYLAYIDTPESFRLKKKGEETKFTQVIEQRKLAERAGEITEIEPELFDLPDFFIPDPLAANKDYQRKVINPIYYNLIGDHLEKHLKAGRKGFFTVNTKEEADALAYVLSTRFKDKHIASLHYATQPESRKKQIKHDLEAGALDFLVTIQMVDEGIDQPNWSVYFDLSNSASPRQIIQRMGRVSRIADGKTKAHMISAMPMTSEHLAEKLELLQALIESSENGGGEGAGVAGSEDTQKRIAKLKTYLATAKKTLEEIEKGIAQKRETLRNLETWVREKGFVPNPYSLARNPLEESIAKELRKLISEKDPLLKEIDPLSEAMLTLGNIEYRDYIASRIRSFFLLEKRMPRARSTEERRLYEHAIYATLRKDTIFTARFGDVGNRLIQEHLKEQREEIDFFKKTAFKTREPPQQHTYTMKKRALTPAEKLARTYYFKWYRAISERNLALLEQLPPAGEYKLREWVQKSPIKRESFTERDLPADILMGRQEIPETSRDLILEKIKRVFVHQDATLPLPTYHAAQKHAPQRSMYLELIFALINKTTGYFRNVPAYIATDPNNPNRKIIHETRVRTLVEARLKTQMEVARRFNEFAQKSIESGVAKDIDNDVVKIKAFRESSRSFSWYLPLVEAVRNQDPAVLIFLDKNADRLLPAFVSEHGVNASDDPPWPSNPRSDDSGRFTKPDLAIVSPVNPPDLTPYDSPELRTLHEFVEVMGVLPDSSDSAAERTSFRAIDQELYDGNRAAVHALSPSLRSALLEHYRQKVDKIKQHALGDLAKAGKLFSLGASEELNKRYEDPSFMAFLARIPDPSVDQGILLREAIWSLADAHKFSGINGFEKQLSVLRERFAQPVSEDRIFELYPRYLAGEEQEILREFGFGPPKPIPPAPPLLAVTPVPTPTPTPTSTPVPTTLAPVAPTSVDIPAPPLATPTPEPVIAPGPIQTETVTPALTSIPIPKKAKPSLPKPLQPKPAEALPVAKAEPAKLAVIYKTPPPKLSDPKNENLVHDLNEFGRAMKELEGGMRVPTMNSWSKEKRLEMNGTLEKAWCDYENALFLRVYRKLKIGAEDITLWPDWAKRGFLSKKLGEKGAYQAEFAASRKHMEESLQPGWVRKMVYPKFYLKTSQSIADDLEAFGAAMEKIEGKRRIPKMNTWSASKRAAMAGTEEKKWRDYENSIYIRLYTRIADNNDEILTLPRWIKRDILETQIGKLGSKNADTILKAMRRLRKSLLSK